MKLIGSITWIAILLIALITVTAFQLRLIGQDARGNLVDILLDLFSVPVIGPILVIFALAASGVTAYVHFIPHGGKSPNNKRENPEGRTEIQHDAHTTPPNNTEQGNPITIPKNPKNHTD